MARTGKAQRAIGSIVDVVFGHLAVLGENYCDDLRTAREGQESFGFSGNVGPGFRAAATISGFQSLYGTRKMPPSAGKICTDEAANLRTFGGLEPKTASDFEGDS